MALWMRGGKDWSWTLHLQSAQWVVLVTTSFSPSLSISLILLAIFSSCSSFLQRFFRSHLSSSCSCWLVSTFLKGLLLFPCVLTCQVFRLLSPSPPLFFNLSKAIYSWELLGGVGFCPQTLLSWEKQWIIRSRRVCAWRIAVRGQLDASEFDLEPQDQERNVTDQNKKRLLDY